MNLANKEEMLNESLKVVDMALSKISKLDDSTLGNIKEILTMCIKYGFEQGVIHGEYLANKSWLK